jgi:hypothetical protein
MIKDFIEDQKRKQSDERENKSTVYKWEENLYIDNTKQNPRF